MAAGAGQNLSSQVSFRGFRVSVALSEKAAQLLKRKRETVIIDGSFTGAPKQGALKQYVPETGEVSLGDDVRAEVEPGSGASFDEVKLKRDALEQTDGQGPDLLINVFSGRRSSDDNLLDCEIYEGPLKGVQDKNIPIHCRLIGE